MAKITSKADLNEGTEYTITLGTGVTLIEAGNLTEADGVTGKALFSALSDSWKSNATANRYRFPFRETVGELSELLEFRGGYVITSGDETFIRDTGVRYTSDFEGSTVTDEYLCLVQAGALDSAEQPYVLLATDTAPTNLNFTGTFNELVKIFDSGGDDDRASMIIFTRTQGRTYGYYDLTTEQQLSSLLPVAYLIPMTTAVDTNGSGTAGAVQSDAFIAANAPYTGMGGTGDGSDLYTTVTGSGFTTATVGSLSLNDVRQDTAGRWFICSGAGTIDAAGVADYTANGGTATLGAYTGERQIDGSYYAFNKIIDGNSGTKEQLWEFHQYMLRQTTDIDSSATTQRGDTSPPLLSWSGTTLVTATGVYVDSHLTAEQSEYIFTDVGGTERSIPFVPSVIINSVDSSGSATNFATGTRIQLYNSSAAAASDWAASTAYVIGDMVLRTSGIGTESGAGLWMECTTAGTSNGSEPTWDTTVGNTTADNTCTWTTRAVELYNNTPGAVSSLSTTYPSGANADATIRYRIASVDGSTGATLGMTGTISATSINSSVNLVQESDTVYVGYGIDGSTVTTFSADYTDTEVDVVTATNFTGTSLYAWWVNNLASEAGIRNFYGGISAIDSGNMKINDSVVNILIDNDTATNVYQTDTVRIFRDDSAYPVKVASTGGGGVDINWKNQVFVTETGVSGLTASESTQLFSLSNVGTVRSTNV